MKATRVLLKNVAYIIADSIDSGKTLSKIIIACQDYYKTDASLQSITAADVIAERKRQQFKDDCKEYAEMLQNESEVSRKQEAAILAEIELEEAEENKAD